MVIGKDFVWAHIPKTGGTSVRDMFDYFPMRIVFGDSNKDKTKHDSFRQREERYNVDLTISRKRIACFRRLPNFLLSYTLFFNKHFNQPVDMTMAKKGNIYWMEPWSKNYEILNVDKAILDFYEYRQIAHWLRMEYLADDFMAVMKNFFPVQPEKEPFIRQIHSNPNPDYKKNLQEWFSKEDIESMYHSCPVWTSIERHIYNGLITDQW